MEGPIYRQAAVPELKPVRFTVTRSTPLGRLHSAFNTRSEILVETLLESNDGESREEFLARFIDVAVAKPSAPRVNPAPQFEPLIEGPFLQWQGANTEKMAKA